MIAIFYDNYSKKFIIHIWNCDNGKKVIRKIKLKKSVYYVPYVREMI
jgi:hypothetical protein